MLILCFVSPAVARGSCTKGGLIGVDKAKSGGTIKLASWPTPELDHFIFKVPHC